MCHIYIHIFASIKRMSLEGKGKKGKLREYLLLDVYRLVTLHIRRHLGILIIVVCEPLGS